MKKLFLIIAAIASLSACDPPKWMNVHDTEWFVKNKTDSPIMVRCHGFHNDWNIRQCIMPKDSLSILYFNPYAYEGKPKFSILTEHVKMITLFEANGDSLNTWSIGNTTGFSRDLFDESNWRKYRKDTGTPMEDITWVFDILPEDLTPARQ